ncbi:zinc finger BED domain-containing protein 1-like, partial [Nothobranchius furzeri]
IQPYTSLTVHFINAWDLRSISLQTSYFPEDHTGELIAKGLRDALDCWNLSENRLSCMTTDSGTNMIKALKVNGRPNLQCFGHKLHNAIDEGKKAELRNNVVGILKNSQNQHSNITKEEQSAMTALSKHEQIIILPADKGRTTVVMDREKYKQQMKQILEDKNTYKIL